MKSEQGYQPTPEEVAKAEEMMTDSQREQSNDREESERYKEMWTLIREAKTKEPYMGDFSNQGRSKTLEIFADGSTLTHGWVDKNLLERPYYEASGGFAARAAEILYEKSPITEADREWIEKLNASALRGKEINKKSEEEFLSEWRNKMRSAETEEKVYIEFPGVGIMSLRKHPIFQGWYNATAIPADAEPCTVGDENIVDVGRRLGLLHKRVWGQEEKSSVE